MHTRSSSNLIVESTTIPRRRNRRRSKQIVKPELRTIVETPVATMADTRTMSELLQAPTEGYGDAIVIPAILAENFELKVGLLQLVTLSQFHGFERDDPHSHIRWFNKITSTLKYKNVPHDAIKLMLFPFSLEGAARIWLEKEPPRSIHTWENLVSKFVNYFFPPSKTTNLKNDITNFQQRFDETFNSLNAAAGGNLLNRTPRDALTIIENKSKVRISRNKPIVSKVSTTTSSPSPSPDVTALTEIVKELVLMNKATQQATVKAIEETCVTCGGPHPYYECLATGGNTFDACAAVGTYNQGGNGYRPQGDPNYRASNQMGPPGFPPPNVQNSQNYNQNRYNQNQGNYQAPNNQGFNQQRGQNFNQGNNNYQAPNYQAPNNQAQVGPSNELSNYMKSNEATLRAMQTQISNITPYGSGSLPSNTIANPRGDLKAITTRSGVSYDGPTIPSTSSPLPKVVKRDPEAKKDKHQLNASFRLEEAFAPGLTPTSMTLELANRSITYPVGVSKDVIVKVGKFHFLADFVVVDYDVDPRVPLIFERPFLRTARALIDVHGEELILRDGDEQLIFHADSTSKHPNKYGNELFNMINLIDITCEDRFPEVLKLKKSNHPSSGNPTPSSNFMVEFSSPSPIPYEDSDSLVEETDTLLSHFNDSSPDYETFCFDIKEKSSGSTNIHFDYSLPDYDAFYFDDNHIKEKSSGSTTTHFDISLLEYDSFIFDLSIDPCPLVDRSVSHHEEFADELAHILYPPKYDRFYFDLEADLGEFTSVLEKDLIDLSTKDFTNIKLNNSPLLLYDCDSSLSKEFSEIDLQVSFPLGNEDIVFNPRIIIIKGVQSHRFKVPLEFFSTISFESDPLFLIDSLEIDTSTSFPSGNEDKIFNPGILTSKVFTSRHSLGLSHRDSEAFKINKNFKSLMEIFPFFLLYYGWDISSLDVPLDHFVEIPSGEIKVHIEVLSVLWGNRLSILDGSLPLFRSRLYKFKEGDFLRLNLRDIEDILLLLVQKKITNLQRDVIFDLNVALRMFTRRVVILKRVEDLQLGVKSYQEKLNITKPVTFMSDISKRTPYTAYNNPQGIIYVDKYKRNRLDYFPKRRWSNLDKQRSRIMIKAIDKL
ncbi:reverse transcriptase domain-containing protein [Tanacetum coccineum]|uniref:Reverse transcriptase domain-containing protein n=1 Tax=Tanacetum coccineum TaxID=301880 RepID=A0ABQ5D126_9ASTR